MKSFSKPLCDNLAPYYHFLPNVNTELQWLGSNKIRKELIVPQDVLFFTAQFVIKTCVVSMELYAASRSPLRSQRIWFQEDKSIDQDEETRIGLVKT